MSLELISRVVGVTSVNASRRVARPTPHHSSHRILPLEGPNPTSYNMVVTVVHITPVRDGLLGLFVLKLTFFPATSR